MRIVITGNDGQAGTLLERALPAFGHTCFGCGSADFDIRDREAVERFMRITKPDAIIHCAAYTAVDKAESDAKTCWSVNVEGTRYVIEAANMVCARMLLFSTDYVFDGEKDGYYETDDPTNPLCEYGRSKQEAERLMLAYCEKPIVMRTSWLFGPYGNNFVNTIRRLAGEKETLRVVEDQVGSPTYTADLPPAIHGILSTGLTGVLHVTNEGVCSWAQFARAILSQCGMQAGVVGVSTREYGAPALRPHNSKMSKSCLDFYGINRLPHWEDALKRYLHDEA